MMYIQTSLEQRLMTVLCTLAMSGMALSDLNGTVVFQNGLGGVANFRIPAIVQTRGKQPALVAFAEARDGGDASTSRIAVRTSTDAGATWSAISFAAGSLDSPAARAACAKDNFTSCRVGNPAVVWDNTSAEVVLAYIVLGFGDGYHPIGNGISRSSDGGKTWGKPTDVSASFAGSTGMIAGMPGPGTALQLNSGPKKGRLLVSSHHGAYAYDTVTVSDSDDSSTSFSVGHLERRTLVVVHRALPYTVAVGSAHPISALSRLGSSATSFMLTCNCTF